MYPKSHILLGIIFILLVWAFFPSIGYINLAIILLSSVLIDVDHYLYFVYRKKSFSLKKAYNWFVTTENKYNRMPRSKRLKVYRAICWLHGIEAFFILLVLSFFSKIFLFILIGFAFHLLVDDVHALYENKPESMHALSAVYRLINTKKLKHIEDVK